MLANKIKKFLCRIGSIYEDGKLRVPAFTVVFWTFISIIIIGGIGWLVYSLITEPLKTLGILALVGGVIVIVFIIGKAIELLIPQFIKTYLKLLGSKLELTCDKVVFPEQVKNIYSEIEALDKENLDYFFKGIRPLCRKLGGEN